MYRGRTHNPPAPTTELHTHNKPRGLHPRGKPGLDGESSDGAAAVPLGKMGPARCVPLSLKPHELLRAP